MSIRVYFLGTGGAGSNVSRGYPAYLFETKDSLILVDAGMGVEAKLRELGFSICDITAVMVSHRHYDHTTGILGLLDLQLEEQCNKPLTIYAPSDAASRILEVKEVLGPRSAPKPIVRSLPEDRVEKTLFDNTIVESFPVSHSVPALGFSIEYDNIRIVYSGDTSPCSTVEERTREAQLLLHEASFPSRLKHIARITRHTVVGEAVRIGSKAEILALIHITHVAEEEARKAVGKRIIVPVDGLVVTIS